MKAVKIKIAGKIHYLAFTGEALFAIRDTFGGASALLEAIKPDTRESFKALCSAAALLTEQGELARRDMGYDPEGVVPADALERVLMPSDILALKLAIPRAIELGFGREVKSESDEIDLDLAELGQKKTT